MSFCECHVERGYGNLALYSACTLYRVRLSPPCERHDIPDYYDITLWRSVSWTTFVSLLGNDEIGEVDGFPLSEARGKDGPFIPCYARLPLEFPKAGVTRRIRLLCAALCAACTRARRCVVRAPVYLLNCLELKPDMCDIVTMFL